MVKRTKQMPNAGNHPRLFKDHSIPHVENLGDKNSELREQAMKYEAIMRHKKEQLREMRGPLGLGVNKS